MPGPYQIKRLILSQFQQFNFCDLDFTHPVTGEVLNEVCLLGLNGSGKSMILSQIYHSIDSVYHSIDSVYHSIDSALLPLSTQPGATDDSLILTEFRIGDQNVYHERIKFEDGPQEKTEEIVERENDKAENNAPSTIQNRAAANRYSHLKRQIQDLEDDNKLADLVDEAFSIRKF